MSPLNSSSPPLPATNQITNSLNSSLSSSLVSQPTPGPISYDLELPATGVILNHGDLPPLISQILPPQYSYIFQTVVLTESAMPNSIAISSTFLTDANSTVQATQWIQKLFDHTKTTYRVTRGTKASGKRILLRV